MDDGLYSFLKNYESDYSYDAEEAMAAAQEVGLIDDFELDAVEDGRTRRWGQNKLFVFAVGDKFIGVEVYSMHEAAEGPDLFETAYEIQPYEVTVRRFKRI
jgi:hypothetical protein